MKRELNRLELFELHSPLAKRMALYYRRRLPPHVLTEDLTAAAMVGLWDAVRRHPEADPGFAHYASVRIKGAILDELRTQDWLPRRLRRTKGSQVSQVPLDSVGDDTNLAWLGMTSPTDVENDACEAEESRSLLPYLAVLMDREREIVMKIHFREERLRDIGKSMGISEPRVSQIHARAMEKLRKVVPAELLQSVRDRY